MIIGICGGSGSGKTTLLNRISENYIDLKPVVFSMDNYYLPISAQEKDENGHINFDLPTSIDQEKLVSDLQKLIEGKSIKVKEYAFNRPIETQNIIELHSSKLIIVEGLFLFHYSRVKELIDFSIFIDVDLSIQLERRLKRDVETRGYTKELVIYQWENNVLPSFKKYLEPYKDSADFIFKNDFHSEENFQILLKEIDKRIKM